MNIKKTALISALIFSFGAIAFVACDKENNTTPAEVVSTENNGAKVASPYQIFNITKGIKVMTYAGYPMCVGNGICFMEFEHMQTYDPWNFIPKNISGTYAAVQLQPKDVLRTIIHYELASSEEQNAWEKMIEDGEVQVSEGAWIDDPDIIKKWNLDGTIELVDGNYEILDYNTDKNYLVVDIPFVYQK